MALRILSSTGMIKCVLAFLIVAALLGGCGGPRSFSPGTPRPANPTVILASTTSIEDSGLMDILIPLFRQQTGYAIKPVYVGSGTAMVMGERGEADVLLAHAPESEIVFMEKGHGISRRLVMYNDFVIVGPPSDPAGIAGTVSAVDAMKKIAVSRAIFISRADNSGTHQVESKLWRAAAVEPKGKAWYQESGQGMGATLNIASEKNAYTIADRATFLTTAKNLRLAVLMEGDPVLLNLYHVIEVNPVLSRKVNAAGAKAFADFMVSAGVQQIISEFGVAKYGRPLFVAAAGKTEADLLRR